MAARPVAPAGGAAAVLINPAVDAGTTADIRFPRVRGATSLQANGEPVEVTGGFLLVTEVTDAELTLAFDVGAVSLPMNPNIFLDVVIRYDPNGVVEVAREIRYYLGAARPLLGDSGSLEVRDNGVTLLGEVGPDGELKTVIDGDLVLLGNDIVVRNVMVTGNIVIRGNNVTVAYSQAGGAVVNGNGGWLLGNVWLSEPQITADDVVLLSARHEEPLPEPEPEPQPEPSEGDSGRAIALQPVSVLDSVGTVLINPVTNEGSAPVPFPDEREGLAVALGERILTTEASGFVVIDQVEDDPLRLAIEGAELDLPFPSGVFFDYILVYEPLFAFAAVQGWVEYHLDSARILDAGTTGTLEITDAGATVVGTVDGDGNILSIIDGDLVISGTGAQIRNVAVTGAVVISTDNVSIAYSEMNTARVSGSNALLLGNVLKNAPEVMGFNVQLLGNTIP